MGAIVPVIYYCFVFTVSNFDYLLVSYCFCILTRLTGHWSKKKSAEVSCCLAL